MWKETTFNRSKQFGNCKCTINGRCGNNAHNKMKKPSSRPNLALMMVLVFIIIQKVQSADVLEDLIQSLASNGASCLVMVTDKWTSSDYLNYDNHIPMTFIDSSINSSRVGSVLPPIQGINPVNDCSYYLLWFKDANRTLVFLQRCDTERDQFHQSWTMSKLFQIYKRTWDVYKG